MSLHPSARRRLARAAAGATLLAASACHDPIAVPDLNNLPADVLTGGLNANTAQLLVTGLLNRDRDIAGFRYQVYAGTLARDVYNIDPSESRFQTELLGNAIDPAGFIGGGSSITEAYNAVRTANTLIDGVRAASDLSAAQQSGLRGIAHTMKALALYRALELRGTNGIATDVSPIEASGEALLPIRCEPAALQSIGAVLDSGYAELQAAGDAFAVRLPAGFSSDGSFDTPSGFARFNRGLRGRAELYRGLRGGGAAAFQSAIAALDASFLDTTAALSQGVYAVYAGPPDVFNPLAAGTVYLNPTVAAPVPGSGLANSGQAIHPDDRRRAKIVMLDAPVARNGVSTVYRSPLTLPTAANQTRPLPILRNAELILLRAQAEIELGRLREATADINVVRTREGGLGARPLLPSRDAAVQAVLYEKRFSLLLEGAQRLVDLRTYGLINAQYLGASPRGAADAFLGQLPIPQQERDARRGEISCRS